MQSALYTNHYDVGNLYVLSKKQLRESSHELISLIDDLAINCITRFKVQEAWLAGLFLKQSRVSPRRSPRLVQSSTRLRNRLDLEQLATCSPPPSDDKILRNLVSLSRVKIDIPNQMFPVYLSVWPENC